MTDALLIGVVAVAALNFALTLGLMAVYVRIYARTRAPFTLALVLFAAAFLGQNALVAYSYGTMMPLFSEALLPYLLGSGVLEAAGLGAVLGTATR